VSAPLHLLTGEGLWCSASDGGLPAIWFADGPHGVRKAPHNEDSGIGTALPATAFPTASALACSWNPALLEEVGDALGREARSLGVHVLLGPGLNLVRHPRGGRTFEYFSEDPRLSGLMAAAMVRGIQSTGVGACLKHFAVNNQEDHRMVLDAIVDPRTLHELYLEGFRIAVQEGRPAAVMAAYNRIHGPDGAVYATQSPLIADVLRGQWGFDGLVISDWGAVHDRVAAVRAGLDLEMPSTRGRQEPVLQRALEDGTLRPEEVRACTDRLTAFARRWVPDAPPEPLSAERLQASHALARRAAAASAVLLDNDGLLPLALDAVPSITLIGALADHPRIQGGGSAGVVPHRVVGLRTAFERHLAGLEGPKPTLTWCPGYRLDDSVEPGLAAEAVAAAVDAQENGGVVVVVVGLPAIAESEGYDRTTLSLPADQNALVRALRKACDRLVVVVQTGGAVSLPWADEVKRGGAVLLGGLAGQASGEGLLDVLLGAVDAQGRLATTWAYRGEDHASHGSFVSPHPRQVEHREGPFVGYRWFHASGIGVRYPFGHGLSYTSFAWTDLDVAPDRVRLTVENTGPRAGVEVVQVYAHVPDSRWLRAPWRLVGWARVELEAGASETVEIAVERDALAIWHPGRNARVVESGEVVFRVARSATDPGQDATVQIDGDALEDWTVPPIPEPYQQLVDGQVGTRTVFWPDDAAFEALLGTRLPRPDPPRPFTTRSTLGDVRSVWPGWVLFQVARQVTRQQLAHARDTDAIGSTAARSAIDPASRARFADAMVRDLPLRGLVTMTGAMSWRQLDLLLLVLNGSWIRAIRRMLRLDPSEDPP
jgi:beta-glucosidase